MQRVCPVLIIMLGEEKLINHRLGEREWWMMCCPIRSYSDCMAGKIRSILCSSDDPVFQLEKIPYFGIPAAYHIWAACFLIIQYSSILWSFFSEFDTFCAHCQDILILLSWRFTITLCHHFVIEVLGDLKTTIRFGNHYDDVCAYDHYNKSC